MQECMIGVPETWIGVPEFAKNKGNRSRKTNQRMGNVNCTGWETNQGHILHADKCWQSVW